MGREKMRLYQEANRLSALNDQLDGVINTIIVNFMKEVDAAGVELMKLLDIDMPEANFAHVDKEQMKKLMEAKGITIQQISNPHQPLRLLFEAKYEEKEFIVGYLIYLDTILNVIKRIRIDNIDERNACYLFLEGKSDRYGS